MVAVSRVYVGVHWPTDVVLGALWGGAAGVFAWGLVRRAGLWLRVRLQHHEKM
jgi:undecaprenyl-diphosphatase